MEGEVARAIFTERLKAENGKWEAEIEWREKRDVSRPNKKGKETEKEVGPSLLTRHVSVVSRARDLRLDRLPLIRESGLLMRGEFRDYKYQRYRELTGRRAGGGGGKASRL